MTSLIAHGTAAATPPCPAFDYRVVYQDSVCSAVILRDAGLALQNLFIRDFPTGNYTSLGDLVRPAPTEAERTTFLNANADGLASASDAFQTWAPGGCTNGELTIYTGSNASNIGGSQGVFLREGFVQNCMGAGTDSNRAWIIVVSPSCVMSSITPRRLWISPRADPMKSWGTLMKTFWIGSSRMRPPWTIAP